MSICDKLPLFLNGEMDKKEATEFKTHMLKCKECRELSKIFLAVQSTKQMQNLPINSINYIFEKTTRKKPFWNFLRVIEVSFASAAVLAAGLFVSSHISGQSNSYASIYPASSYEEIASVDSTLDKYEQMYLI